MHARFLIDAVFTVEGRGTVLQGTLVEGQVARGMSLAIPGIGGRLVIGRVDAIHARETPLGLLGLVISEDATGSPDELKRLAEGKTVDIELGR